MLRTEDAVTPSLTGRDVLFSFVGYVLVYLIVIPFGIYDIYQLLRPTAPSAVEPVTSAVDASFFALGSGRRVVALAILIYVVLDGFGLGVGMLFGTTRTKRSAAR